MSLNKKETKHFSPCGVVVNVLECEIVEGKFEFKSSYCVHFRTNAFGKDMNLIIASP